MAIKCEKHLIEKRTIQAGVSKKTGKPYPAFEICDLCSALKREKFYDEPQRARTNVDESEAIKQMASIKNKTIEKAHAENMRAACIDAASRIAAAQKIGDADSVIEIAETYLKWIIDEPPF